MKLRSTPLNAFKSLSAFGVIFQYYLGKHCAFKPVDSTEWNLLFPNRGTLGPFHFEHHFGKGRQREARVRRNFRRVKETRLPFLDLDGDFAEAYAPVLAHGKYQGALISGPVLRRFPTPDSLRQRWKSIFGSLPGAADADFIQFVRVVLSIPCLTERGLQTYLRTLSMVGAWLQDPAQTGISPELTRQLEASYSFELPHDYWVDWMINIDRHLTPQERKRGVEPWVRSELGVTRIPTIAAALMAQTDPQADTVHNLCLQKAFQHTAYRAVRRRPDMAAKMLGDFGIVLVTSASQQGHVGQQRLELIESLEELRRSIEAELSTKVHAGLGRLAQEAGDLATSQQDALAALNDGLRTGKAVTLAHEPRPARSRTTPAVTRQLFRDLIASIDAAPNAHLVPQERLLAHLVRSDLSPDALRPLLAWAFGAILDRVESSSRLSNEQGIKLHEAFSTELSVLFSQPGMLQLFRTAVDSLVRPADGYGPKNVDLRLAMRSVRKKIEKAPEYPWTIKELCHLTGCSAPTVLKWFSATNGAPFGAFVRRCRMEKAGALLRNSERTVEQIARSTGYGSASSFIQAFQRYYGKTPGSVRLAKKVTKRR